MRIASALASSASFTFLTFGGFGGFGAFGGRGALGALGGFGGFAACDGRKGERIDGLLVLAEPEAKAEAEPEPEAAPAAAPPVDDAALALSAAYRLKFVPLDDDSCRGARLAGFIPRGDGASRAPCYTPPLHLGDVLVSLDDRPVVNVDYAEILAALRRPPPQSLRFVRVTSDRNAAAAPLKTSPAATRKKSSSFSAMLPKWR